MTRIINPMRAKRRQIFREEMPASLMMGLCNLGDMPRRGCTVEKTIAADATPARKAAVPRGSNARAAAEPGGAGQPSAGPDCDRLYPSVLNSTP